MAKAHPSNVAGPFYVEEGCCITCGVPHDVAPEIFGWTEDDDHCFVKKQPETNDELDRTLQALWSSEVQCIRYRGSDPAVARRIAEFGNGECCDVPAPDTAVVVRDQVTFHTSAPDATPAKLAARLRGWLVRQGEPRYEVRPAWGSADADVNFSWTAMWGPRAQFHLVHFERHTVSGRFAARLSSGHGLAMHGLALVIHEWLRGGEGASRIRWFSREEARSGAPGLHMPL